MLEIFVRANIDSVTNTTVKAWLSSWSNPFSPYSAGLLRENGMDEHYGIGDRFGTQYSDLVNQGLYNPLNMTFQNTRVERTAVSAQSFSAGLFDGRGTLPNRATPIYSFNLPDHADPLLRPFDTCPAFSSQYDNALSHNTELASWNAQMLPSIASRMSALFGTTVNTSLVQTMHEACAFEFAVLNQSQQFCTLFNDTDFQVFEYATDLLEYWSRSYGLPIGWQIAAPLLSDFTNAMRSKFDSIVSSSATSFSTSSFKFAHAETMMPFLSILGLYNDSQPLRASWTWDQIHARQFRTSWLFPFASNLAMLGYDCANSSGLPERFYVKLQHNERDVTVPGCESTSQGPFCGFTQFLAIYDSKLSINFGQLCSVPIPQPPPTAPKFYAIYVWGPTALMATMIVSLLVGFYVGTRRPMPKRSEPLLSGNENY